MSVNESFTARIRKALRDIPHVEEKKMFRGIAFMVKGKLCISVGDDRMMCRIDPIHHEQCLLKPGCEPVIMRGREYKGYIYIHEEKVRTESRLKYWVELALEYNKVIVTKK